MCLRTGRAQLVGTTEARAAITTPLRMAAAAANISLRCVIRASLFAHGPPTARHCPLPLWSPAGDKHTHTHSAQEAQLTMWAWARRAIMAGAFESSCGRRRSDVARQLTHPLTHQRFYMCHRHGAARCSSASSYMGAAKPGCQPQPPRHWRQSSHHRTTERLCVRAGPVSGTHVRSHVVGLVERHFHR
jgi:hypothetical protein